MAGSEGERPHNREVGYPPRAFMGGERYERSEVHIGGTPLIEIRLRNGVLQDISHLYTWLGEDGQKRWRTERQSIASFVADVRAGKEQKDSRYENIPEDQIPSSITHTTEIIYSRGKKPREGDKQWVHLRYLTSSDQPEQQSTISILDSPVAGAAMGAEPKQERGKEREEQDVFAAGREKDGLHEDAQQRRSVAFSGDDSYQNHGQGEQRDRQFYDDANTADTGERGDLYADIGLSSADFKRYVAETRNRLRERREETEQLGNVFNEAEFLREGLEGLATNARREGALWDEAYYGQLLAAWDALAFESYGEAGKEKALRRLSQKGIGPQASVGIVIDQPEDVAKLDIMATAIGMPFKPRPNRAFGTHIPVSSEIYEWGRRKGIHLRENGI